MTARSTLTLAAIFGFLAVLLGAFGAHGLKDSGFLEKKYQDVEAKNYAGLMIPASHKYMLDFETGVRYHMWHALALGLTGFLMRFRTGHGGSLNVAAGAFTAGVVLFSGSLYVLVIGGPKFLGIPWGKVAPIGGTLLLVGWLSLAWAACCCPQVDRGDGQPNGGPACGF
ncbi:MAG: DUF423 domain-containing protein [Planctomycetaceae bacterium]